MPTTKGSAVITKPADDQILIEREFDAPRHLVYRAYTEPELIRQWWSGLRGEMTVCDVDLEVGGRYRFAMTANEGFEVAFNGVYREIAPDERIVHTEIYEGAPEPGGPDGEGAINTVTFEENDDRTTLTILMEVANKEERDMILSTGMEGGLQEALDLMEQTATSLA